MDDPSKKLPRDETGSYLHLKLKRFPSVEALSMSHAKKTWAQYPQDADIDVAPSNRSKCRQCHQVIEKGNLRARLWLQCHRGCKISAYFHGKNCVWKYPETSKINKLDDFDGIQKLSKSDKQYLEAEFAKLKNETSGKRKPDETPSDIAVQTDSKKKRSQ